eukprot:scaffold9845_cov63-Phaeocystis_antarctica.AAC.2
MARGCVADSVSTGSTGGGTTGSWRSSCRRLRAAHAAACVAWRVQAAPLRSPRFLLCQVRFARAGGGCGGSTARAPAKKVP